jgi:lactoylglutathione lyase
LAYENKEGTLMRLGYVIIYVPDVATAVEFYESAFGLKRRFIHESGYGELETGATALAFATEQLAKMNGVAIRPNRQGDTEAAGAEIALVVADPQASFKRAVAAGATKVREPTIKPWGQTVAYVRDLNGFLVEICSEVNG